MMTAIGFGLLKHGYLNQYPHMSKKQLTEKKRPARKRLEYRGMHFE